MISMTLATPNYSILTRRKKRHFKFKFFYHISNKLFIFTKKKNSIFFFFYIFLTKINTNILLPHYNLTILITYLEPFILKLQNVFSNQPKKLHKTRKKTTKPFSLNPLRFLFYKPQMDHLISSPTMFHYVENGPFFNICGPNQLQFHFQTQSQISLIP